MCTVWRVTWQIVPRIIFWLFPDFSLSLQNLTRLPSKALLLSLYCQEKLNLLLRENIGNNVTALFLKIVLSLLWQELFKVRTKLKLSPDLIFGIFKLFQNSFFLKWLAPSINIAWFWGCVGKVVCDTNWQSLKAKTSPKCPFPTPLCSPPQHLHHQLSASDVISNQANFS